MYLLIENILKIENDDIYSYNLTRNATPSSELTLGGCCISSFNVSFDSRPYKGSKFNNVKVDVYNDKEEKVGEFYVDTPGISNHVMSLECTDILRNASVKWIGRGFPCTMFELYSNILIQIGINSKLTIEDFPCGSCVVNGSKNLMNMTCIDILSDIAEMNGGFFFINTNGELDFKTFDFSNIKEYNEDYIHEISNIEQVATTRKGLFIVGSNNKEFSFGDTSNRLRITDNEIIKTLSDEMLRMVGNSILNVIKYYEYNAATISLWQDDTPCEIGDVIKVVDIDGKYHTIIIHELSYSNNLNYCSIECYGDDIKTKATQETSTIENEEYVEDDEGHIGRGVNHQTIRAKQGTYTIVEKSVKNISYFSHVFLSLHIDFYYTTDKILVFNLYANDKYIGKVQKKVEVGLNTLDCSFNADVDLSQEVCTYSCRVEIEEGCELIIEKSKAILSLIVENCKIDTIVATDQYFIEKFQNIPNTVFNQRKISHKNIYDSSELVIPASPIATGDMSRTSGVDNISYFIYDDGTAVISGDGEIKKGIFINNFSIYSYNFSPDICDREYVANNIKNITITGGITLIPTRIFQSMFGLETVTINSTTQCTFEYQYGALGVMDGISEIKTLNFGAGGSYIIETTNAFADLSIENVNGEEYIIKMDRERTFCNTTIASSLDLSGCEEYYSNNLEKLTCPYVTLSKNLKVVGGNTFKNSNFDSVFVVNNDMLNINFDLFAGECFDNCCISTFIIAPNAADAFSGYFDRLENIIANNKKIYVPSPHHLGKFATLENDPYNFEVIAYEEENYENLLNEVWR